MNVVIINGFDTFEHRVDLVYDYFQGLNAKVTVIASNFMHICKKKRTDKKEGFIFVNTKPYKKNMSIERINSHYNFAKDAMKIVGALNPDIIYALVPPNSVANQVAKYKRMHEDVKVIFDLIDLWPETMPISKFKNILPFKMWAYLRNDSLKYANFVVTECDLYRSVLEKYLDKDKVQTIYLAREYKEFEIKKIEDDTKIRLCYLGSINNIIDLNAIDEILRGLVVIKPVEFHIIGDGEKRTELIKIAKEAGTKVVYHGKIYESAEKQAIFSKCHFGLNIMKESVCVGLTMKSIDYFEAGLPIINNIKGDTWEFVEELGVGINYSKHKKIELRKIDKGIVRDFFEDHFTRQKFDEKLDLIIKKLN